MAAKNKAHGTRNKIGQRFGRLIVVAIAGGGGAGGQRLWLCLCDCGALIGVRTGNLSSGNTASCGCARSDATKKRNKAVAPHGEADKTPEYKAWTSLKERCLNPEHRSFAAYGGRGISVCMRWLVGEAGVHPFLCFLADMGRRPSPNHSIERNDNDGGYQPDNCRWATRSEQQKNKRPYSEWAVFK